jgi:hypothetical protein
MYHMESFKNEDEKVPELDPEDITYLTKIYLRLIDVFDSGKIAMDQTTSESIVTNRDQAKDNATAMVTMDLLKEIIKTGYVDLTILQPENVIRPEVLKYVEGENLEIDEIFKEGVSRMNTIIKKVKDRDFSDYSLDFSPEELDEGSVNLRALPADTLERLDKLFFVHHNQIVELTKSYPEFTVLKEDERKLAVEMFTFMLGCVMDVDNESVSDDILIFTKENLSTSLNDRELELYDEKIRIYVAEQVITAFKRLIEENTSKP